MPNRYFVFLYTPGENWVPDRPVTEQPLAGHVDYMQRLHTEHRVIIEGPFKDNTGMLGIIEAASLDDALAIVNRDPAVMGGVVQAAVHPWHPSVTGFVDKKPW